MDSNTILRILGIAVPNYLLVAGSSWLSRVITTAISLLSIRIVLDSLGIEHYAAYVVVVGLVGWFMLADFGIGLSLQNHISAARTTNHSYASHILVASVIVLALVSLITILLILGGTWPAAWLLSQFSTLSGREKYVAFTTVASLVVFSTWGGLIYRVWYAEHRGYLANLTTALASIASLIIIIAVSRAELDDKLLWFLVAVNAPLTVLPAIALVARLAKVSTSAPCESIDVAGNMIQRGIGFWMFNLIATFVLQIDYIILSQFVEPSEIVTYYIISKIFAIAGFAFSAVHQAFWPVCAESVLKDDWNSINSFIRQYMRWGMFLLFVFTALVAIFLDQITTLISPSQHVPASASLVFSIGLMYAIRLWTDIFAVILQSTSKLKVLNSWAAIQAVSGLALQLMLVPKYGIYGTVAALSLSWVLTVSWALPRRVYLIQRKQV